MDADNPQEILQGPPTVTPLVSPPVDWEKEVDKISSEYKQLGMRQWQEKLTRIQNINVNHDNQ